MEAKDAERGLAEYQQKFYLARAKAAAKRKKSGMSGEFDENFPKRKKSNKTPKVAPQVSRDAVYTLNILLSRVVLRLIAMLRTLAA